MPSLPFSVFRRKPRIGAEDRGRFEDESLCTHCGGCCYLSFQVDKESVIVRELPCRHLRFDEAGKSRCEIYGRRLGTDFCFKVSEETVRSSLFPQACPYVEKIEGYRGKVYLDDRPELRQRIVETFAESGCPTYIREADWRRFFGAKDEGGGDERG